MEWLRSRAVTNVAALYGVQALGILVPLATFPFLVRTVGLASFGTMNYAMSWAQLGVVVTALGFNYTATRRVAAAADDTNALQVVYSSTMVLKLGLAVASIAALLAFSFVDEMLSESRGVLLGSCALVLGEALFPSWLFLGLQRMSVITKSLLVGRVLGAVLLFSTVRSPSDEAIATLCQSVPQVIAGVVGIGYAWRSLGVRLVLRRTPRAAYREGLRESFAAFSSSLPNHVYARGQFIVLGQFVSATAMGQYAVAQRIVGIFSTLAAPLADVVYPHICRLVAVAGDWPAFRRKILMMAVPASATLALALALAAPLAIALVAGDDDADTAPLLRWLAPMAGFILVSVMLRPFSMALQRYRASMVASLIAAGLFLALSLLLTPRMGAMGMVFTMVAVEGAVMVLAFLITRPERK